MELAIFVFISEKCVRTPRRGPRLSSWVTSLNQVHQERFYKLKVLMIDARRPRHQTGGRELGRPPRAAAGEGALLSDSRGSDPGGPEGRPCSRANLGI